MTYVMYLHAANIMPILHKMCLGVGGGDTLLKRVIHVVTHCDQERGRGPKMLKSA